MHKRTIVARSGNRFKLDRMLVGDFWIERNATATTLFALFDGMNISDIAIENIALDGNKANNENLNGNFVGCIFLRESNRIRIRNVTARNFNGDAMSWQVCHDVRVEDCHCHDSAGYGMHAGSGSQRTVAVGTSLSGMTSASTSAGACGGASATTTRSWTTAALACPSATRTRTT
jgi:hypothetical protein